MDTQIASTDRTLRLSIARPKPAPREGVRRPARIAQQLAFAHHLRRRIEDGVFENQSDAALAYGMSRNRISQILALTFLAPDIQLELLALEAVDGIEPPITEKWIFAHIARRLGWDEQRVLWSARATRS